MTAYGGFNVRAALTVTCLVLGVLTSFAQTRPSPAPVPSTQKPGMTPRPPLLFSEPWKLPPYTGEQTELTMEVITTAAGYTRSRKNSTYIFVFVLGISSF